MSLLNKTKQNLVLLLLVILIVLSMANHLPYLLGRTKDPIWGQSERSTFGDTKDPIKDKKDPIWDTKRSQ